MAHSCGRCGQAISYSWFWSKDIEGYDRVLKTYQLFCSACGNNLCVGCTRQFHQNPSQPIFHHFTRFNKLEPVICHNISPAPFFVLCSQCNARLGFSDGSCVKRMEDFYQRTGRSEDLADLYESLGWLDKAGDIRRKSKQLTVRQVSVDLNQLIDRIQSSGLAVPYRCRNCGASITVSKDSSAEGLMFCSFCGSAVDVDSLMQVLKGVLG